MKTIIIVAIVMLTFGTGYSMEKLVQVDKLTEVELYRIRCAQDKVMEANSNLDRIKTEIATEHKMSAELWMEWSSRVEINNGYILMYRDSYMEGVTIPCIPIK